MYLLATRSVFNPFLTKLVMCHTLVNPPATARITKGASHVTGKLLNPRHLQQEIDSRQQHFEPDLICSDWHLSCTSHHLYANRTLPHRHHSVVLVELQHTVNLALAGA